MEQDDGSEPTAWFQPPINTTRRRNPPTDPVILILLLPIIVLLLLFFFSHPLLSHIPKNIKPTFLKFTWNSLNLFLILFAILCGIFAPKNNDVSSMADAANPVNSIVPESYEYQEKAHANSGLRRSSRSYPDLRQESESLRENGENRLRFSDDFGVDIQYPSSVNNRSRPRGGEKEDIYRSETISGDIRNRPRRREAEEVHVEGSSKLSRNVPVTLLQLSPLSPPAPAPALPLPVKSGRRRTSRSLGRDETVDITSRSDKIQKVSRSPPPSPSPPRAPPPPPPPPLATSEHRFHRKHNKLEGTLSESTTELATKIDSVDDPRNRKGKIRQKSIIIQPVTPSIPLPPPPPPPIAVLPPPPPLRSIFNAIFKSGRKKKRFPSKTSLPPPPPPPSSIITGFSKTETKSKHVNSSSAVSPPRRSTVPVTLKQKPKRMSHIKPPLPPLQRKPEAFRRRLAGTDKPPLPTKSSNSYDRVDFLPNGSQSPLIPTPPPFMMPALRCELRGSSPDREPVDLPSITIDVGDSFGPSPISFPSPDVNVKADCFISTCKDKWRLENSKFN